MINTTKNLIPAIMRGIFGPMGSGKSESLAIRVYQYTKAGKNILLLKNKLDTREESGFIMPRSGQKLPAIMVDPSDDVFQMVQDLLKQEPFAIFVDEIHFFEEHHLDELANIAFRLGIEVNAFGLLSTYQASLFDVIAKKLPLFNSTHELKVMCPCGHGHTRLHLKTVDGEIKKKGPLIEVGEVYQPGMDISKGVFYYPVCNACYNNNILPLVKEKGKIIMRDPTR